LGLPDIRVDCCIHAFAFVGAIKRPDAKQIAKTVNDRGTGIIPGEAVQIKVVFPNIEAWIIKEKAVAVERIFKLNKRVHCRDESSVEDHIHKCYRMEDHVPEWKIKNFERTRQRKRDALKREFVADMLSVGFRLD
jgi:hypothetical protein